MSLALKIILILLAVSLVLGIATGQSLYYRLTYVWIFLLLGSYLFTAFSLKGINIVRRARTHKAQVGEIFEERYEINNSTRIPHLWIEITDQSPLPGSTGSHVLTAIGGRESRTYLARSRLFMRGVFALGPTKVTSGDLFGLFKSEAIFPNQSSLLIYPKIVSINGFPKPSGILPGGEALRRRTTQITSNAAGVREYASGDPLNRIHWISTARRSRLMVKEFELDPLADIWLFLDCNHNVHHYQISDLDSFNIRDLWGRRFEYDIPMATIEYAVSIAGSIADYFIKQSRAVGMICMEKKLNVIPPDRGGRQFGKLLEALAMIKADGNIPIENLVETQARFIPRGSTVVLISPSSSQNVVKAVDLLYRRNLRPVVILIDSSGFGGYHRSNEIAQVISVLGVPVYEIEYGDDISEKLSYVTKPQKYLF